MDRSKVMQEDGRGRAMDVSMQKTINKILPLSLLSPLPDLTP